MRLPDGALYRWHFERGPDSVQIDVDGPLTLDESSVARAAVLAGTGIGFFFEHDVRDDIAIGRLVRLLEDWTPPFPGLCLYHPNRRHPSAGLAAFFALTRETARAEVSGNDL